MPSIREDLQMRLQLELSRRFSTSVSTQEIVEAARELASVTANWLATTYEEHSMETTIYGEAKPIVCRPSYEWLVEAVKA